ncbi:hypothetical protein [Thalassotalea maritima]|uniref:hypothetical protein n=1 Tax=Thalassotalea maritima TaxID=3242416 RepID=UPI00352965CE
MNLVIPGIIVKGHQIASGKARDCPYIGGSISQQLPFFKRIGIDITGLYSGTINIDISPYQLALTHPDQQIEKLAWYPGVEPETFSFCHCSLAFAERCYQALIYYPHPETKPAHFHPAHIVEVLAPYIDGIAYGQKVWLSLSPNHVNRSLDKN